MAYGLRMAVLPGPPAVLSSVEVTGSTVMALRNSEDTIYLPRSSKPIGELPRVFLVLLQASALPEKIIGGVWLSYLVLQKCFEAWK